MSAFVLHIASGQVFFTGVALLLSGLWLTRRIQRRSGQRLSALLLFLGLVGVAISSTPFPLPFWIVGSLLVILASRQKFRVRRRWLMPATIGFWLLAAGYEATWQRTPHLPRDIAAKELPVVVLADSVTAGLGEGEAVTWPKQIQETSKLTVIDLSHVGETVASALRRARDAEIPDEAVVVLELGGNDILGSTPVDRFEEDLDALLTFISRPGRCVFLMELPLPPFCNKWGIVQRRLAKRHNVKLIPKHRFAAVFAGKTSTLDSIHLSQEGHDRMAAIVREVLLLHSNP
ncbi:MAG: GDSL-type esterase/lipase family protein [Planctomycetaceae bacterium]